MQYNIDLKKITLEVQFDPRIYQKLLASVLLIFKKGKISVGQTVVVFFPEKNY